MNGGITRVTKFVLDFLFVMGIIVIVTLPVSLRKYGTYVDPGVILHLRQMVLILGICGVFSLMIIWELRKMFKTVIAENCFVRENVKSLNRMGNCSFIIAVVMLFRCIMIYVTLAALAMIVVFIIAGLFSKVLSKVFDRAVTYKLENDLTI